MSRTDLTQRARESGENSRTVYMDKHSALYIYRNGPNHKHRQENPNNKQRNIMCDESPTTKHAERCVSVYGLLPIVPYLTSLEELPLLSDPPSSRNVDNQNHNKYQTTWAKVNGKKG